MKIIDFLKAQSKEFILSVIYFFIFGILFYLLALPLKGFFIALGLCFIAMMIYTLSQIKFYLKKQKQEQQLQYLIENNHRLKEDANKYQSEMEEYFLLWAHQIKTPITAANLLLTTSVDSQALEEQMNKIENYTNQALNYLKVANPQTDMRLDSCSLDEIIQPIIVSYRKQFIQSGIRLDYQPLNANVLTDSKLCQVMIDQLINNALKYAVANKHAVSPYISIRFGKSTNQLIIEDSGQGIRPEDLPKIFERGYTGFNGRVHEKATGIGLYLVKRIAKRIGITLDVQSTYQKGSTFFLTFPRESFY